MNSARTGDWSGKLVQVRDFVNRDGQCPLPRLKSSAADAETCHCSQRAGFLDSRATCLSVPRETDPESANPPKSPTINAVQPVRNRLPASPDGVGLDKHVISIAPSPPTTRITKGRTCYSKASPKD